MSAHRSPVSAKRKYRSKLAALLANAERPIMAHAYLCPHCRTWHLTRRDPLGATQPEEAA